MRSQFTADIAACAMSEHESEGVDDGHQRKYHAGRAADAGSELADKKGVCHVVDAGHQHADCGGKPQPQNQLVNRCFCHFVILFLCTVSFHISVTPDFTQNFYRNLKLFRILFILRSVCCSISFRAFLAS